MDAAQRASTEHSGDRVTRLRTSTTTAPERALALGRFPLVRTHSIDELEEVQAKINSQITARALDARAGFQWQANRVTVDRLAITVSRYEKGAVGHAPDIGELYSLIVPLRGAGESRQAGRAAPMVAGQRAAMISPSMPADFSLGAGYEGVQVTIPRAAMESACRALLGGAGPGAVRFDLAVELAGPGGAAIARMLAFLLAEAERDDGVLRSPLVASDLSQALIHTILASQPHDQSHCMERRERPAEPRFVRQAEHFLEAHCDRPIRLEELTELTGVSARTLHAGFRGHRGWTPMEFLRERRLELARQRLSTSSPVTTKVAAIALDCGFTHLGRFSLLYKARFGESPLATLRGNRY